MRRPAPGSSRPALYSSPSTPPGVPSSFLSRPASCSSGISPDRRGAMSRRSPLVGRAALGIATLATISCAPGRVAPVSPLAPADVALYARVLAAADARRPDSATIDAATGSTTPAVRRAGALAAGQLHLRTSAPMLRALLRDADSSVAARAAFAIALLRDTASIAALDSALSFPEPVAIQAAFALGEIGERARAAIVARADSAPAGVRVELLLATAKLRPVPPAPAIAALASGDPCVRWAGAYALSRPRVAAGVSAILAFSRDARLFAPDSSVHAPAGAYECAPSETRAQVARALVRAAAGDSLAAPAVAVLRTLVADSAPHVRINALRSLATFGDSAVAPIVGATRDRDANVRIAAAQSLSGRTLARDLWLALWNADSATMYRRSL